MTIKRRLLIANIIMVLSPIIVTAIIFFGMRIFVASDQTRGGLGGRFADMPAIPTVGLSQADEAFTQGNFTRITSDITLYHSHLGDYIIILPDTYQAALEDFISGPNFILPVILFYLLTVLILANILLARYITHKIMTPLNSLAGGVREITSGNLTHRISYAGGDEFDTVCSDFNEMAAYLSHMVQQRQADENSRKELIAGISHDLRTPLTSVKAYLEGLRKGIASTPQMQEKYLDIIQSKTEDIEYIIKQLFMFSKIDVGEFPLNLETVDIGAQLAKIVCEFSDEYKESGLEINLTDNTHEYVHIDTVQFNNIVQNILCNSVKYSNRRDPKVEIHCVTQCSNSINDMSQNKNIVLSIKDNGPGVPEEMLPYIFDVFYRGDKARNNPGSGLGLAISSKLINRMNGTIIAKNVPEGGLEIVITLLKIAA